MTRIKQRRKALNSPISFFSIFIASCIITACYSDVENNIQTKYFTMQSDEKLNMKLPPSDYTNSGVILINDSDSLFFQFGVLVSTLAEKDPNVIYVPDGTDTSNMDLSNIVITSKLHFDIDRYRRQNVTFKKIDGFNAKITYPRMKGKGITGLYIDSLSNGGMGDVEGIISFHMYAKDLDTLDESLLLKAFETLKFQNIFF